jgi:uncharacterized membrane protein YcaP (DUF421 family)
MLASVSDSLTVSGIPLYEKALRTIAVYLVIVLLLRVLGRRDLAQLNSLDLVVLLLLSNIVQNAIIGDDNSLTGGLFGAAVLLATNFALDALAYRYERVRRLFEGKPTTLVEHGQVVAPWWQLLTDEEIAAAVRRQNATGIEQVERATLRESGTIDVDLMPFDVNATRGDLARLEQKLERKLDELLARPGS